MTASQPMVEANSRRAAYLHAGILLLPVIAFWVLARLVLWPRLEWLWSMTGFARFTHLSGGAAPISCAPEQIISFIRTGMLYAPHGFFLLLAGLLVAEICIPDWSRARKVALTGVVIALTCVAFAVLTAMCVSAIMAHPPTP